MDVDSGTEEKKNPQWDIGLTGELVTAVFGAAQWKKAHPSVRSMADRPEFCRYHYHEALDMMNEYIEALRDCWTSHSIPLRRSILLYVKQVRIQDHTAFMCCT